MGVSMRKFRLALSFPLTNLLKPKYGLRQNLKYLLLFLFNLLLFICIKSIVTVKVSIPTSRYRTSLKPRAHTNRVSVWYPRFCDGGSFQTIAAKHSPDRFPYAVLRDAIVDRRPAVAAFFRKTPSPSLIRVTLFITVHNSAKIFMEGSNVTIGVEKHSDEDSRTVAEQLSAYVEYVVHGSRFLLRRGPYKPGTKTIHGRQTTDWHVGLVLELRESVPVTGFSFGSAADYSITLIPSITVRHYDNALIPFKFRLPFACIQGWTPLGVIREANCSTANPHAARGAALFSGSALYGHKKRQVESFREVAHFAARALTGPIRYDTVVMSVVMDTTISDADVICGTETICRHELLQTNIDLLQNISTEVERELDIIGLPQHVASNIIIIPSCTLGSATEQAERGDACAISKHYGQYWATVFTYASLAPFYRWSASYDMDEFIAPEVKEPVMLSSRPADDVFDEANVEADGSADVAGFVVQWLNFLVNSTKDSRDLSVALSRGYSPQLEDRFNSSRSPQCYVRLRDDTGKSVLRCDAGFGFSIHHPMTVVSDDTGNMAFHQSFRMHRSLRTWHARFRHSKGTCAYSPRGIHVNGSLNYTVSR